LSRTREELEKTAAECEKFGVKAVVVPADMTDEEQVNEAVEKVSLPNAYPRSKKLSAL
jgi:short-subunit dehydrogenase